MERQSKHREVGWGQGGAVKKEKGEAGMGRFVSTLYRQEQGEGVGVGSEEQGLRTKARSRVRQGRKYGTSERGWM